MRRLIRESAEERFISAITAMLPRSLRQINGVHEADAELIEWSGGTLAVTTDTLAEEIHSGLYRDPAFIGWMLAIANLSDLAAVGAEPLGLLTAMTLREDSGPEFVRGLASGIADACIRCGTFLLGGDMNFGEHLSLTGTALGAVPSGMHLTRIGCRPGDRLYVSHPAGGGNAFAFTLISSASGRSELVFKPVARIAEGIALRGIATACMDTSDGLLLTLDTLSRLNECRFGLTADWNRCVHPAALDLCRAMNVPAWAALAGIHGDYDLCFTVRASDEQSLLDTARRAGWSPIPIGEVTAGQGISIVEDGRETKLDTHTLRELSSAASRDPRSYVRDLLGFVHRTGAGNTVGREG
jgi:thiamine-monophosphate kinase